MRTNNAPRIAFVHNYAMWYRLPFFEKIAKEYPIDFFFTQENSSHISDFSNMNYEILLHFRLIPPPFPEKISPIIVRKIMEGNYDLVIWGDTLPLEATFLLFSWKSFRRRLIVWSGAWEATASPYTRVINILRRRSKACITYGTKHREYLLSTGVDSKAIFICGNVSNLSVTKTDTQKRRQLKEYFGFEKVILFVGRILKNKGVQYLIRAFEHLSKEIDDVGLLIIGDGPYKAHLLKLAERVAQRTKIHFSPWIAHKDLVPYYLLCDVFVLPSYNEAWGLVLNEAMSLGKPVIATDGVGGAYDLIVDGINGFVVKQKNTDALYLALKRIIQDPTLAEKMGQASRKIIRQRFTYNHMVNGFKHAIEYAIID